MPEKETTFPIGSLNYSGNWSENFSVEKRVAGVNYTQNLIAVLEKQSHSRVNWCQRFFYRVSLFTEQIIIS